MNSTAGTSWTFSNLTPNSQLSYDVYGYWASGTLTGLGYTVGDEGLGARSRGPSLGPGWYKLGSVMVSGSTSTLTVDGPTTSAVCLRNPGTRNPEDLWGFRPETLDVSQYCPRQ